MPKVKNLQARIKNFVGLYILNSQMLQYSDLGIVERIRAVSV